MPTASPESILELPGDRDSFIHQLPQRIAAIEENWSSLSNQAWSAASLERLYGRVREISEASSRFGLYQLNESVFSLEVYLSSFVGIDETPAAEQLTAIEGLLRNLKAAAEASNAGLQAQEEGGGRGIFLLGANAGDMAELAEAIAAQGAPINFFEDVDGLLGSMDGALPGAIVADTSLLPKLSRLSDELARLKHQAAIDIPLVFLSTSSVLQLRVDAIRAGGDAYFVSPIDAQDVAQSVLTLSGARKELPYRVMVVEDDPTQAEFAASILRKADMQVMVITDPMRVLEALREFTPDLILMDIYMPEVNGIELTTIIREYNEFVGIPIVFLSGEQNTDKQMDALSVGGDDFVAKPIRPKHLLTVVQNRVRRTRRLLKAIGTRVCHDRVTGLLSAQQFEEQIARALAVDPAHTQPTGILVVAPDNIEQLREQLGIGGLDQLLAELGQQVRAPLQQTDAASRLGEHSLGLLLRRDSNRQIEALCEQLHQHLAAQTFNPNGTPIEVTVGIGMCLFDENLDDPKGLLSRAEAALQQAQNAGPGQTHVHTFADEVDSARVDKDDDITATLRQCLANNNFVVRYQPLLDLQTRGSENYEIILRMPLPSGDQIRERDFREPAERAGLSGEIDRWLLDRAIEILRQRRNAGRQTHIFVHQSGASLIDPNHPAWLLGRLRAQQMVGTGLVLDFRLSDLSSDIRAAQKNIAALREFDVQVCLSRFPEKDAAFKVLRFVRANYISIAPRLLKAERQVISDVIGKSHKIGAKVIVSNIDDPRSIDLHWSSGADFLQGNFIQRPLDNMDYDFSQVVI